MLVDCSVFVSPLKILFVCLFVLFESCSAAFFYLLCFIPPWLIIILLDIGSGSHDFWQWGPWVINLQFFSIGALHWWKGGTCCKHGVITFEEGGYCDYVRGLKVVTRLRMTIATNEVIFFNLRTEIWGPFWSGYSIKTLQRILFPTTGHVHTLKFMNSLKLIE